MIRVYFLDDHQLIRAGLVTLFEREPDFHVVGGAAEVPAALVALAATPADVVIVDVSLRVGDGLDFTRRLIAADASSKVLILTARTAAEVVAESFEAGARGFASKDQPPSELFEAVRVVARGGEYLAPGTPVGMLEASRRKLSRGRRSIGTLASLSPRERQLFDLAVGGHTNEEAAVALGISLKTVQTHRAKINDKLGIHSSAQLVHFAARRGLVGDS